MNGFKEEFTPEDSEAIIAYVNQLKRAAEEGLAKFKQYAKLISDEGYYIVAQSDDTLFVYKDITETFDTFSRTTRISLGKIVESKQPTK